MTDPTYTVLASQIRQLESILPDLQKRVERITNTLIDSRLMDTPLYDAASRIEARRVLLEQEIAKLRKELT